MPPEILTKDRDWAVPAHGPIEVLRTIRRYESTGILTTAQADVHAHTVMATEVRVIGPDAWVLAFAWQTRHNIGPYDISPYDAPYVAIARRFNATLVTLDGRLASAAQAAGAVVAVPKPSD